MLSIFITYCQDWPRKFDLGANFSSFDNEKAARLSYCLLLVCEICLYPLHVNYRITDGSPKSSFRKEITRSRNRRWFPLLVSVARLSKVDAWRRIDIIQVGDRNEKMEDLKACRCSLANLCELPIFTASLCAEWDKRYQKSQNGYWATGKGRKNRDKENATLESRHWNCNTEKLQGIMHWNP